MTKCLACGDTGQRLDGTTCDCGFDVELYTPQFVEIPKHYVGLEFDSELTDGTMDNAYGELLDKLLSEISATGTVDRNYVICSPTGTSKTVFAYTAISRVYSKGGEVSKIYDLNEIRPYLMNSYDKYSAESLEISTTPLLFIRIPLDVPSRFGELVGSIVERRGRYNGRTIFLYGGCDLDLKGLDTFGRFSEITGDGKFSTVKVVSYKKGV